MILIPLTLLALYVAMQKVVEAAPHWVCHYIPVAYLDYQHCEWTRWHWTQQGGVVAVVALALAVVFVTSWVLTQNRQ